MSLTLAEARHRTETVEVDAYGIDLDLTGWERGRFACTTTVRFTATQPRTFLELTAAEDVVVGCSDADALTWEYDGRRLTLEGLPTGRPVEVVVAAQVPYVTDGDGMHLMTDPEDGETYVSAYLSLDVAQRVFACFDQPDLKATFTVSVTSDPRWTVLGNGRVVEHDADAGRWTFATTPRICPSLFVVCAGPWHSVTWEHAGLPFGWHARASLAAELDRDAAELMRTTTDCFDHYATLFEQPYPFDSYDQLFGPGHNWGAMETPGCVTYRDELLPRGRVTDDHRARRAAVIAHEMAHMWFGNLVTMRWWEDTWLNESFADYMGYRVAEAGAGFAGTLVLHEATRKPGAHVADERRSTHPVAPAPEDVPDVDSAFSNFDAISYSKGNSCLRQLVTWLGDEDFLAGVNAHLGRHAFGNATLEDLVSALDEASPRDVRAWADAWLRTPGFDTVAVSRDGDGVPVLHREGTRPHRFTVTAFAADATIAGERLVDLDDEPLAMPEWAGLVVVPNSRGESFVRLRLDEQGETFVRDHLGDVTDDLVRTVLWAHCFDEVRTGAMPVPAYVDVVRAHLATETSSTLVAAVLDRTLGAVRSRTAAPEQVGDVTTGVAGACLAGLALAPEPEVAFALTRGVVATTRDADLLERWLRDGRTDDGVGLDPSLHWSALARLAALGAVDAERIDAERVADGSFAGELGAARALAARPTTEAKAAAWAAMTEPDVPNRLFEALASGLWDASRPDLCAPYVDAYLAQGPDIARRRGQGFSLVLGRNAFPALALSPAQRSRLADVLAGDVPTVLARQWNDALDDLG